MTKEQKRIKIAKSVGWKTPNPKHYRMSATPVRPTWMHSAEWDGKKHSATSTPRIIPNYFDDLNEVSKLRKTLNQDERAEFVRELQIGESSYPEDEWLFAAIDASADKQAEAYGVAKGLWK